MQYYANVYLNTKTKNRVMSATIEANRPVLEESPHLLQAQAAAYVAENISNQWDMETSLAHVALIGSGVSMPDAVVRERAWLPSDEDDKGGVAGEAIFTKDALKAGSRMIRTQMGRQ